MSSRRLAAADSAERALDESATIKVGSPELEKIYGHDMGDESEYRRTEGVRRLREREELFSDSVAMLLGNIFRLDRLEYT